MTRPLAAIACLALVSLAGCVSHVGPAPSRAQIAAAEIGPKPSTAAVQRAAQQFIYSRVTDPSSATLEYREIGRGWYAPPFCHPRFSWELVVTVTARDVSGAYTAPTLWSVHVRDGAMVAYARPLVGWSATEVKELEPPIPLERVE